MESDKMESIVHLKESLSSDIISVSVRSDDSQGCTADVKETPPSPEEKMLLENKKSFDSGVSFKSDQLKNRLNLYRRCFSPRPQDFFLPRMYTGAHDLDRLLGNQMAKGSMESFDSGVPCQSRRLRSLTSMEDFSSSKKKHTLPDLVGYSDDLMALTRKRSSHSGVSHQDKRLSSLLRTEDFSLSEKKHTLPDLAGYSDDLMFLRSARSSHSGVSFKSNRHSSLPRDKMIQELSSEVGWKHR